MGKISSTKKALNKALDMAQEARLARARELGYVTDIDSVIEVGHGQNRRRVPETEHDTGSSNGPGIVSEEALRSSNTGGSGRGAGDDLQTFYHGTSDDIEAFRLGHPNRKDLGWLGEGVYVSTDPRLANTYTSMKAGSAGPNVLPLNIRTQNLYEASLDEKRMLQNADASNIRRFTEHLKSQGYDGATLKYGDGTREVVVFDPANVRSTNAAFDPAKKDSANLLASLGGAAVLGGAALGSDEAEAGPLLKGGKRIIEAWHGSPHKFDRFDISKIGTGEGAQAYGHGLYAADVKDTAKAYIPRDLDHEEWMYQQYKQAEAADDLYMMDAWERAMQHEYPSDLRDMANDPDYDELTQEAYLAVADALEANPPAGSLVKVHLDVDPDTLLDWDNELSGEHGLGRAILEAAADDPRLDYDDFADALGVSDGYYGQPEPGSSVYSLLESSLGGQDEASRFLADNGIPGIRYLDGQSRGAGEGSYNYVMFDDKPISIQERGFADPALLAATATFAAGAEFYRLQQQSDSRWSERRARLGQFIDQANEVIRPGMPYVNQALEAIEMPMRGLHGITAALGSLAAGNGVHDALMRGGDVARQPIDQTADQLGGAVVDATGSPLLGTAVYTGANMADIF